MHTYATSLFYRRGSMPGQCTASVTNSASFILALRDSGVLFICGDMPDANTRILGCSLSTSARRFLSARRILLPLKRLGSDVEYSAKYDAGHLLVGVGGQTAQRPRTPGQPISGATGGLPARAGVGAAANCRETECGRLPHPAREGISRYHFAAAIIPWPLGALKLRLPLRQLPALEEEALNLT